MQPHDARRMGAVVMRYSQIAPRFAPDGRPGQKPPSPAMTVFVADDDEAMREAVAMSLRAMGHHVMEARDGVELLDLVQGTVDASLPRPDVLVADVQMPHLSGFGVLAALQQAHSDIPILLMTALSDASLLSLAQKMGAIGILRKPFDLDDLLTAVLNARAVLERPRSSRSPPDNAD
jgi:two-component system nitrogen regulation response regulator GlnG